MFLNHMATSDSEHVNKKNKRCLEEETKRSDDNDSDFSLKTLLNNANFYPSEEFIQTLRKMKLDDWLVVPDDIISAIGYKYSCKKSAHHRGNCFKFIKKSIDSSDFKTTLTNQIVQGTKYKTRKVKLEMKVGALFKLIQLTVHLREESKTQNKHYLYVLHNPWFLNKGPNVYKVGYTTNLQTRVKGDHTMFLSKSTILYSIEVPSRRHEWILHNTLKEYRITEDREFFDHPLEEIKKCMDACAAAL